MADVLEVEVVPPVRSCEAAGVQTLPQHLMRCAGDTTFALYADDQVEILRSDQPICRLPLADLLQFAREAGAA